MERLSRKKDLAESVNTKDLLESKAHRENEALEYLLQENERLEITLATVQLKEQKYRRGYSVDRCC